MTGAEVDWDLLQLGTLGHVRPFLSFEGVHWRRGATRGFLTKIGYKAIIGVQSPWLALGIHHGELLTARRGGQEGPHDLEGTPHQK